jgi:ADP-ribosylglycohydrolase
MDTKNRYRGAWIGLAVGEAIGAQLEGVDDITHTPIVLGPPLRYGADTPLAMYVGRAVLSALETSRGSAGLGDEVARMLIAWHQEATDRPLGRDPSTWAATERLIGGVGWRDAGDPLIQPSAVAVRAVPIGLAFDPREVAARATVATLVTHRDPTALESAVFVAWTTSRLVRGASFDRSLVEEGREYVADFGLNGALADALADALGLHASMRSRPLQWLRAAEIHPNDGGHHAESAVGLAVVAALLAGDGPDAVETSIELAARIHGDNSAVAALTGAFLGAARGAWALPRHLVEPLEGLDVLVGLADALWDQASGLPTDDVNDHEAPTARSHTIWPTGTRP